MNLRTLDELSEFFDKELAWRKKELSQIKLSLDQATESQTTSIIRIGICMLYAHWEGFIKAAATGYVCYVATRRLKYHELAPGFVALGLKSNIVTASQSKRATLHVELISLLLSEMEDPFTINCERVIDSQSNLNSRVMEDILCTLGMDDASYLSKGQLIDNRLLYNRNNIAHGKFLTVDVNSYIDLHYQVIELIDRFGDDIKLAAEAKLYRRPEV